MLLNLFKTVFIFVITLLSLHAFSQKNIIIDEDLDAHSEALKVKMGAQGFGKIAKWKFGEYAVVQSKNGGTTTKSKSNFWNTKTESKSSHRFSFTLCNANTDSAFVNAEENAETKAIQGFLVAENFSVGNDELLLDNNNFTTSIQFNGDTSDVWVMLINTSVGSESENSGKAVLFSRERKIIIVSTSSNKNDSDKKMFPALGYEFIEDEKALGAVQYLGSGMARYNKNIVWIRDDLDQKMKLILAAACTAIMQNPMNGSLSTN